MTMPQAYLMVSATKHPERDGWVDDQATRGAQVLMNLPKSPPYAGRWVDSAGGMVHLFADGPDAVRAAEESGYQPVSTAPLLESPITPMLDAVQSDLSKLDINKIPGGRTYQATALWIARVIDKRGDDEGPSVTAKLADQLTKVMTALTRKGGDDAGDSFEKWTEDLSTPSVGG